MPWRKLSFSSDFHIRRAKRRDHPALAALWWRAVKPSHGFVAPSRLSAERSALTQRYLPACTVWAAQDTRLLGFVAVTSGGDVAGLFVDPTAQGQGVGRRLLDHVRQDAALFLDVAAPNIAARRFYQSYGFHEVSRQHDPDLDETLVRMHLPHTQERRHHG